ncbi:hypothetical protein KVR01_002697 [Diaporthe batatas]|uniref:uncharacterized protein n=1 Tax=Diaporthe batatas TaxID=748121 RepID=UPI001D0418F4|nr:uncharacterized protein KVR01_002697 [Diaporthe batatas]KAG8167008.1 hypothetical protein KVR01_002697 [Diaporthe batatas]
MTDSSPRNHLMDLGWRARVGNFDTPTRFSQYDDAHRHLMKIAKEPGQKAVAIPDAFKDQHGSMQTFQGHDPVQNFVLPIRQPMQPNYSGVFSGGAGPSEKAASEKYYWPMNSIHGIAELSLAEQPLAMHPGLAELKYPKPILVSDKARNIPFDVAKNSVHADESNAPSKVALGFSPEYHGDPNLPRNRSANIPDELNCSLFLVNLPPALTTHRLITAIHAMGPTGRIYATHINAPEPDRKHYGCAAKVIFFELTAAKAFYRACEERGFTVEGFGVRVMWNRIKTAQQEHARSTTRVLLIGGDPSFVNPTTLTEYFCTKLQFQIDCIITHSDGLNGDNTDAVVEYRFGSFRCQAEAAKMALVREHPEVRCFFHCDPCDPEHWKPSDQRIPVAPAMPMRFPTAPPPTMQQHQHAGFRVGSRQFPGLPVVHEAAEEQHAHSRPALHPLSNNRCS